MITDGDWNGVMVAITGVCGTVGSELFRQLHRLGAHVVGLDQNEGALFDLDEDYRGCQRTRFFVADVRDLQSLSSRFSGVEIVFHAAALKHVEICERAPREALRTNLMGTMNVIDAALANGVGHVVFASSDKAVKPTNVMGATKLLAERLMTTADAQSGLGSTRFTSVRFGNVLGSSGSVIPLFRKQIAAGGPVTLTDRRMTRFVMTEAGAAASLIAAACMGRGGEVFVPKMVAIRIEDLVDVLVSHLAPEYARDPASIAVQVCGCRLGERLSEGLLTQAEAARSREEGLFFVVAPLVEEQGPWESVCPAGAWRDSTQVPALSRAELAEYLLDAGLIGRSNS